MLIIWNGNYNWWATRIDGMYCPLSFPCRFWRASDMQSLPRVQTFLSQTPRMPDDSRSTSFYSVHSYPYFYLLFFLPNLVAQICRIFVSVKNGIRDGNKMGSFLFSSFSTNMHQIQWPESIMEFSRKTLEKSLNSQCVFQSILFWSTKA